MRTWRSFGPGTIGCVGMAAGGVCWGWEIHGGWENKFWWMLRTSWMDQDYSVCLRCISSVLPARSSLVQNWLASSKFVGSKQPVCEDFTLMNGLVLYHLLSTSDFLAQSQQPHPTLGALLTADHLLLWWRDRDDKDFRKLKFRWGANTLFLDCAYYKFNHSPRFLVYQLFFSGWHW